VTAPGPAKHLAFRPQQAGFCSYLGDPSNCLPVLSFRDTNLVHNRGAPSALGAVDVVRHKVSVATVTPANFEDFYVKYAPLVRRLLARRGVREPDLDDVTQETFVTLHRLLPGFEGRSTLETWLHSVAWRMAANHRRRARMHATQPLSATLDGAVEPTLESEHFSAGLDRIDDDKRDLLALHEIGGMSISALAELTGYARATIRQRLESGRAALVSRAPTARRFPWLAPSAAPFEGVSAPAPFMRVLRDGKTCMSVRDNVLFTVWRGPSSVESLQDVIEVLFAQARVYPAGIRYFALVEPTSSPPTREGRNMVAWAARELGTKVLANASTAEGTLKPLVVSVMNAALFLARTPINTRFFTELAPAISWLAQFGALDVDQSLALIERMRGSLGPASAG
jgi:RNA polymerase sigma-70 factor (ECF subfamily)